MRANIYVRKENEARWTGITDKSAWVNAMLEKSPPNSTVEKLNLEPDAGTVTDFTDSKGSTVTYDTLANVRGGERITVNEAKVCKHGADPSFCKYAKPGKVCK